MKKVFVLLFIFICASSFSQNEKKGIFKRVNYGFNYGTGHEDNFLFNNKDYSYDVKLYKVQLYYPLQKKDFFLMKYWYSQK